VSIVSPIYLGPCQQQLALAIMGFYGGLYVVSKVLGALTGGKKVPAITAHAAAHGHSTSTGDIPSVDSPAFANWLEAPGNVEKFFESASK
jgi:hypothetical protein